MLTYNTQQKRLVLPEYGRNIQRMVDHCLTIEDRDERTRCAYSIIKSMGNLFPQLRENEESRRKLWDHLAIMADFKLDIDYPCAVISEAELQTQPDHLGYDTSSIRLRHYGHYVEQMIEKASAMDPSEERDALVLLLANHMKKLQLSVNADGVDDAKIFKDLADFSHGAIRLNPEEVHLHEFVEITPPGNGKKKKKK